LRSAPRLFLIAAISISAGCTLPDLKPFAEATRELRESVRRTQQRVQDNLDALAKQDAQFKAYAGEFADAWRGRLDLLDALLDYSASLSALSDAGQSGKAPRARPGSSPRRRSTSAGSSTT
jgi:hypothetical protein